jgi:hypothetical protein
MNELQTKYEAQWKDIAEKLAYISFTNQAYEILSSRNFTHEDIVKFVVAIFCPIYQDEITNKEIVELTVRFTVYVGESNKTQEITFIFNNKIILNALVEKIYSSEFGCMQRYEFHFDKPNSLELFDAEFYLMELLNLEVV